MSGYEYTVVPSGPFIVKRNVPTEDGLGEVISDKCETREEADRLIAVLKSEDRRRARYAASCTDRFQTEREPSPDELSALVKVFKDPSPENGALLSAAAGLKPETD